MIASTEVTLTTDQRNRALVLTDLHNTLDDLSMDLAWSVHVTAANETRRDVQSRLMWVWHKEWALHNGHQIGWAHGSVKSDLLLPIKMASDHPKTRARAELETKILQYIPAYNVKIAVAYDTIRSKSGYVSVKEFAQFLSDYQVMAGQNGCILTSSRDQLDYALMRDADSRP